MVYKYVCVFACSVDCRTVSHFHFCTWLARYHLLACANDVTHLKEMDHCGALRAFLLKVIVFESLKKSLF